MQCKACSEGKSLLQNYTQIPMLTVVFAIPNGQMPSLTFRLPVLNFVYIGTSRFSIARFPPLLSSFLQIIP